MTQDPEKPTQKPAMTTITGLAASRGFAAGPVFVHRADVDYAVSEYEIAPETVAAELWRFHAARAETRAQLEALVEKLKADADDGALIFKNHLIILDDQMIVSEIERYIRVKHFNVEAAIRHTVNDFRKLFGKMKDAYLSERIRDVEDIERRILGVLLGKSENSFAAVETPVIVVADDLTPSETVALPRHLVLGFATDRGSTTSHVALLARALGIPSVVGIGDLTSRVKPGDYVLLDGTNGAVTLNPDEPTCAEFSHLVLRERKLHELLSEDRGEAAKTGASATVRFGANVQPGVPLSDLATFGAQCIGLYRSEYLWLTHNMEPGEEEQTAAYTEAVRAAAAMGPEARVTFRVLDLGGDKLMRGHRSHDPNPFLGNRSIRYLLSHRNVFRSQLRAILRASAVGPCAVLYPMIATTRELREANLELRKAMDSLRAEGVPFDEHIPRGCMIEVPSAALNARQLAREVDFFSIGTNDLIQYTMAADRGNEYVAYLYQPTNPGVIRLIDMTAKAAKEAGIEVAVCGETASDPVLAVLWAGLGVNELSMSASYIPVIKKALRALSAAELDELAGRVRELCAERDAEEIYAFCRSWVLGKVPQLEELQTLFSAG